tara:strand:+ start:132 stop:803 length:672 start_codon:yes stop_codon:yes gene_type:complete
MIKEFEKRILSSLILIPLAIFFIIKGSVFFAFFLIVAFLLTSYEWIKMCKKFNSLKIFGIIFLFLSFFQAFSFRENFGLYNFLFLVLICIFTDLGGYIFGKTFKGPKLTKISPNKTYTGVFGSFACSLIIGILMLNNFPISLKVLTEDEIYLGFNTKTQLYYLLLILSISLISQIGDLIISYFKRLVKVKDTGRIIPGHGGLLDRIDGLIFVMPIFYIFFELS